MAVTLTQLSQEAQRRSYAPPASAVYCNGEITHMPTAQDFYNGYYMPPPQQHGHHNFSPPAPTQYQHHLQETNYAPPLPAKIPIQSYTHETMHHYLPSPHSSQSSGSPLSPSTQSPPSPPTEPSVEPDPLPPHSNPQALTTSQSKAFADSTPISPVRIGKDEVYSSTTGLSQYIITREGKHMPSFLSTKPLLTVRRAATGTPAGHVRFHTLTTSSMEMTVNGRQTTFSHAHRILHSRRWGFQSTASPDKAAPETLFWKKDRATGGAMLEDSKHKPVRVLARMKGDLLTFEQAHLSDAAYDEIVLSAIAMAEAARRAGNGRDVTDLASAIGDFASGSGREDD